MDEDDIGEARSEIHLEEWAVGKHSRNDWRNEKIQSKHFNGPIKELG
jgi:hypothetical protein